MQAVVLAVRGKEASVLEKGGGMRIIENEGYQPGQILELPELVQFEERKRKKPETGRRFFSGLKMARQAAAVLVLILGTGLITVNGAPCSIMTMDVNPSLRYTVNAFDRVIALDAYNGDGVELREELIGEVQGRGIDDAMELTLDALRKADYLNGGDTTLVITVSSAFAENADRIKAQVLSRAESWNENQTNASVHMDVLEVEEDVMEAAARRGISPGKLYLTRQLNEAIPEDEDFDEEEWLNRSVADIEAATRARTIKPSAAESAEAQEEEKEAEAAAAAVPQKKPVPGVENPVPVVNEESSSSSGESAAPERKKPRVSGGPAVANDSGSGSSGSSSSSSSGRSGGSSGPAIADESGENESGQASGGSSSTSGDSSSSSGGSSSAEAASGEASQEGGTGDTQENSGGSGSGENGGEGQTDTPGTGGSEAAQPGTGESAGTGEGGEGGAAPSAPEEGGEGSTQESGSGGTEEHSGAEGGHSESGGSASEESGGTSAGEESGGTAAGEDQSGAAEETPVSVEIQAEAAQPAEEIIENPVEQQ